MTDLQFQYMPRETFTATGTQPSAPSRVVTSPRWGMLPLGWTYQGRTTEDLFDLWAPPGNSETPHSGYLLRIPRALRPGQYEIVFEYTPPMRTDIPSPDDLGDLTPHRTTLWAANISTTSELNARLIELHALAGDPDVLNSYTALTLRRKHVTSGHLLT